MFRGLCLLGLLSAIALTTNLSSAFLIPLSTVAPNRMLLIRSIPSSSQPTTERYAFQLNAKKNKESDVIEVDGIVKESLPNAKFRVELVATKAVIVCSTSGKMRKNFVRVLVGDPVKVELSPYDLTRGRITYRSRTGKGNPPDSSPPPPPPSS